MRGDSERVQDGKAGFGQVRRPAQGFARCRVQDGRDFRAERTAVARVRHLGVERVTVRHVDVTRPKLGRIAAHERFDGLYLARPHAALFHGYIAHLPNESAQGVIAGRRYAFSKVRRQLVMDPTERWLLRALVELEDGFRPRGRDLAEPEATAGLASVRWRKHVNGVRLCEVEFSQPSVDGRAGESSTLTGLVVGYGNGGCYLRRQQLLLGGLDSGLHSPAHSRGCRQTMDVQKHQSAGLCDSALAR